MARLIVFALVTGLIGCSDPPPDTGTENPAVTTPAERPSDIDAPGDSDDDGFVFRIEGGGGPLASYALDEGGQCLVYAERIVRVEGTENGDDRAVTLIERTDASPFEQCDDDGDSDFPRLAVNDSLLTLAGTVLWTVRLDDDRTTLRGRDVEAGETLFDAAVTSPVEVDSTGLIYGGPPESFDAPEALEASGVACPEAEGWFAEGRSVAISRRLRFAFEGRGTADTGEARCFVGA